MTSTITRTNQRLSTKVVQPSTRTAAPSTPARQQPARSFVAVLLKALSAIPV